MHHRTLLLALAVATPLLTTACAALDEADLGTDQAELSGTHLSTFQRGLVGVVRTADARPRVGLAIGPNKVLVHRSWVDGYTAAQLTVTETDAGGTVATKRVRWVHPLFDGESAILLTDTADTVNPFFTTDRRAAAALVGVHLDCVGYAAQGTRWGHLRTEMLVTGGSADALQLAAVTGSITASDLGTVCYDPRPSSVGAVGYVVAVNATGPVIRHYAQTDANLAQLDALIAFHQRSTAAPTIITTMPLLGLPSHGVPEVASCVDVPDGGSTPSPLNYYPCHGDSNQRFVRDTPPGATFPRLIAEGNGLCLTSPNPIGGTDLRLERCSGAASQDWQIETWRRATIFAPAYTRIAPRSAPNLCLAVDGWNRDAVRPIEQRACAAATSEVISYDQRWQFRN